MTYKASRGIAPRPMTYGTTRTASYSGPAKKPTSSYSRQTSRSLSGVSIPRTAFSFAANRVPEHPDFAIGAYISEPFMGMGSWWDEPLLPRPGYDPTVPSSEAPMSRRNAALLGGAALALAAVAAGVIWWLPRAGEDPYDTRMRRRLGRGFQFSVLRPSTWGRVRR